MDFQSHKWKEVNSAKQKFYSSRKEELLCFYFKSVEASTILAHFLDGRLWLISNKGPSLGIQKICETAESCSIRDPINS